MYIVSIYYITKQIIEKQVHVGKYKILGSYGVLAPGYSIY